jgi:UDP-N-acetyl-D-mannosaminuronic acid dehydrogenase
MRFARDVVVVGGCGRAGLPLAIALADQGLQVAIFDICGPAVAAVNARQLPFAEAGAAEPLRRAVDRGLLVASADPAFVSTAEHVIMVVADSVEDALAGCAARLKDGQILILRSTLSPGTTARAEKLVASLGADVDVAFCPERIAEGHAMAELHELPQIVASRTARGLQRASRLFSVLTPSLVTMSPEEAELAKLFTNAWRYIRFAAANQFYMIANDLGLDYDRIRRGLAAGYPRAAGLAPAGFAAGPCLLKDTVGLADASAGFALGRVAVAVNLGLPGYLVSRLEMRFELATMAVGILGMAFKAGSDDIRESLSYPLANLLRARAREVLCTDPLVTDDPGLLPLHSVIDRADLLVIAAPHALYRGLRTDKPVADVWNLLGRGVLV